MSLRNLLIVITKMSLSNLLIFFTKISLSNLLKTFLSFWKFETHLLIKYLLIKYNECRCIFLYSNLF